MSGCDRSHSIQLEGHIDNTSRQYHRRHDLTRFLYNMSAFCAFRRRHHVSKFQLGLKIVIDIRDRLDYVARIDIDLSI